MSCECETLIVGEAGPRGQQGLSGTNGSNGTNGINAFSEVSVAFTQPNEYPTNPSSVTVTVSGSQWMGVGQLIYISEAGYYKILSINSTTSIVVRLISVDGVAVGGTVPIGKKISPSSSSAYVDPDLSSLIVNQNYTSYNPVFKVFGSNTSPLITVDAIVNKVGVNASPLAGSKTLTVGGTFEVTGDAFVSSGVVEAARFRTGNAAPSGQITNILFSNQSVTITLAGTVGAVVTATATLTGAALGDAVLVGYGSSPVSTFETDVDVRTMVTSADTISVFFTNRSTNAYPGATINLNLIVLRAASV
jgi:hypothetical protein